MKGNHHLRKKREIVPQITDFLSINLIVEPGI